jgi:hypothetical protein
MATAPATTVDNVKTAFQQYQAGQIVLGDFLAILLRFLDLTPEPELPVEPPAPAPAPAVAVAKKEDKK